MNKKFKLIRPAREGSYFSILSLAEPFWRQVGLLRQLYQDLKQKLISQDFINLTNKITKYKKQNKDTKELEKKINNLVYRLYNLDEDEIKFIKKEVYG